MRMWMVNPRLMCNQHLLGEHCETHMFVGTIKAGKSLKGYIKNDLLEPLSLLIRHDDLVQEMLIRGMKHKSREPPYVTFIGLDRGEFNHAINVKNSLKELIKRCKGY